VKDLRRRGVAPCTGRQNWAELDFSDDSVRYRMYIVEVTWKQMLRADDSFDLEQDDRAMEQKLMNITLSPHGAELLRAAHNRHPELSVTELLEDALTVRYGREVEQRKPRTREEVRVWLDELASLSDEIPAKPSETFSREMIYQDHD